MNTFYDGTTSDNYKQLNGSGSAHFIIMNDNTAGNELSYSKDGQNTSGRIKAGEGIDFRDVNFESIWIKSYTAGNTCAYRVWFFGVKNETAELIKREVAQIPLMFVKAAR